MAKATKKCRVCGKEYEYCHTVRRVPGIFRWQDVACSSECGATYLAQIEESRSVKSDVISKPSENEQFVETTYICDEDEEIEESNDEFDEDEEFDEDSDYEA